MGSRASLRSARNDGLFGCSLIVLFGGIAIPVGSALPRSLSELTGEKNDGAAHSGEWAAPGGQGKSQAASCSFSFFIAAFSIWRMRSAETP